jgi:ABC-type lipoprotein export system ATPase subunit
MTARAPIIRARGLTKRYGTPEQPLLALDRVDLDVAHGEIVALVGSSGSGKSTLLNLLGCLDRPTSGEYALGGCEVAGLGRAAQAWVRRRYVGFVFQSFHLIATASALENVALPLYYAGVGRREREGVARGLLARVGLEGRAGHRPAQLSGGQQQRVAIARALANGPRLLLADEPTGALDSASGREVLALLESVREREGVTVIVVTHDPGVAGRADRRVRLGDGRVVPAPGRAAA